MRRKPKISDERQDIATNREGIALLSMTVSGQNGQRTLKNRAQGVSFCPGILATSA